MIEHPHRRSAAARPSAPYAERFVERIRDAEEDLEREIKARQHRWQSRVHRGRVWFDRELREAHRRLRYNLEPLRDALRHPQFGTKRSAAADRHRHR